MVQKFTDSEIAATPLCLGNISKDWSVDNMKKTGFTGYVYDFSIDYDPIAVNDIKDIHKYLMEKNKYSMIVSKYSIIRTFLRNTSCKATHKCLDLLKKYV